MSAAHAIDDIHDGGLLTHSEERSLRWRLTMALTAACCLILSTGLRWLAPSQGDVAELVAGVAALLVAVPALRAAWWSLRHPDLHGITDQLIALAVIAAWAAGDLVTAALLPLVMTIGHVLEERSLLGSQEAIRALGKLTRTRARRTFDSGAIEEVDGAALRVGDMVELRAGDVAPADGIVVAGASSLDTASISGESAPREVSVGSEIHNGSINHDGVLKLRVTRVGGETALGRVVSLLREAEQAKPAVTRVLEQYSERYLALVLLVAAGTWFVTSSATAMLAVLVASCPCALVLAAPATSIAAIAVASRHGVLVKGAAFLESLATVNSLVVDKTGTMTVGELRLTGAAPREGVSRDDLIRVAARIAGASGHPVSRALASLLPAGDFAKIADARETKGFGVVGVLDGERVALGRGELFRELGVAAPDAPEHDGPVAGVSRGEEFLGWLMFADEPRKEAAEAMADLRALGLDRQLLLTGDRWPVARAVARTLGVSNVQAEVLPADKMRFVQDEIARGLRPLVVGDGVNDALALKAGAVGIAMGAQGTDVALASADIVLMTNDLRRLGTCVRLSRKCRSTIHANVAMGLGWTLVIIALAATNTLGASGAVVAALLHNFSTFLVMANAGRLLKFQEMFA